ncbi:MAG: hypothetical protein WCO51_09615 [bacterium]
MRVRCISTDVMKLSKEYLQPIGIYPDDPDASSQLGLTVGKIYTVYAIFINKGGVYYIICDDDNTGYDLNNYPKNEAAPLFEVIDGTLSKYWCYEYYTWHYKGEEPGARAVFVPMAWANDDTLYSRIVDCEPKAQEAWWQLKRLMDDEAEGC